MKRSELKTPCYILDVEELDYNFDNLATEFLKYWNGPVHIGYSIKTNHLPWLLAYLRKKGALAEVVSSDEYRLAELVGYKPKEIILNGPNKTFNTLKYAAEHGSIINIDSMYQIEYLGELDIKNKKVGLRINFDLEQSCPNESAMGDELSRFGFNIENDSLSLAMKRCLELDIKVCGLHMHQSSKTRSLKVFRVLAEKVVECVQTYKMHDDLEYIDIGGGFFGGRHAKDKPSFNEYAKTVCDVIKPIANENTLQLIIEPGASIIATPISYFTKVIDVKQIKTNTFVTVDGTSLHVNPFLKKRKLSYKCFSEEKGKSPLQIVCGSSCIENDRLLKIENSNSLSIGDIIQINNCGSYTMCFNSFFISLPPVVYAKKNDNYKIIRDAWEPSLLFNG